MHGTELKERKGKLSGASNKMNDSVRLSWYGVSYPDRLRDATQELGQEHRKRICNNDFVTVEKLEASSIASYQKTLIQLANADFEVE
ncbi:hypothetical protein BYT27DRAFT_7188368 [Phlegmacium glaucopus]|nr:hypothetical protein BYT27DRAFT_7188368 [Phlegmacium glaucopus]